jgi:hypothetical protein
MADETRSGDSKVRVVQLLGHRDDAGAWEIRDFLKRSVVEVSRPCLSAKLHLDLALGDSGNRDGDGDHVGGAFQQCRCVSGLRTSRDAGSSGRAENGEKADVGDNAHGPAAGIARFLVERAERLEDLVDRHRAGGSRGVAQRRRRFDGAGVRSPGGKNGQRRQTRTRDAAEAIGRSTIACLDRTG